MHKATACSLCGGGFILIIMRRECRQIFKIVKNYTKLTELLRKLTLEVDEDVDAVGRVVLAAVEDAQQISHARGRALRPSVI